MKRKRYTEEQIIGMLKEHEAGITIEELARKHGITSRVQGAYVLRMINDVRLCRLVDPMQTAIGRKYWLQRTQFMGAG